MKLERDVVRFDREFIPMKLDRLIPFSDFEPCRGISSSVCST